MPFSELTLQCIQPGGPEALDAEEPLVKFGEAGGIDPVKAPLGVGPDGDELGLAQDFQMLRDGGCADFKAFRDFSGRELALGEEFDDAPAGRIGEGGEG